jgi:hypothetical protein
VTKPYDSAISTIQQSGQLQITAVNKTGEHFGGYLSVNKWNLTGARASVQLVQATSSTTDAETNFTLSIDANNWYRFKVENGTLYFYKDVGGLKTSVTIPYNSTQHKWLGLRHDASDRIIWETSPDGVNWTARRTENRALPITALNIELQAGTYQSEQSPGKAIFDNFTLESNPLSSASLNFVTGDAMTGALLAILAFGDDQKLEDSMRGQTNLSFGTLDESPAWLKDLRFDRAAGYG